MEHKREQNRGRGLFLALLGLVLLLELLTQAPVFLWKQPWQQADPYLMGVTLAAAILSLLPNAAVLWAIYRGSWPGLALLCISVIQGAGGLIGALQFGGAAALNSGTALSAVVLLARVTLLLAIFRHDGVSRFWSLRQAGRQRKDLVLEIVLFVLAALAAYGAGSYLLA